MILHPRHWRFKVVEWLDGWFHSHLCNVYEVLLDKEIDDGRHPPIPQEDE
jgi:hypothetical protein